MDHLLGGGSGAWGTVGLTPTNGVGAWPPFTPMPPGGFKAFFCHSPLLLVLFVCYFLELRGKRLLALMPTVALLLAVKAMATPVFADLGGLPETYQESIIVPAFQGVCGVIERRKGRVSLGHRLYLLSVQLSRAHCKPIILFVGWRLSVIMLRWLRWRIQPRGCGQRIVSTCQSIVLCLLQQCLQQIQGSHVQLVFQMYHHGAVFGQEPCIKAILGHSC